ncbi:aminotransferase class I/II-fold pyridoxal phosphate-dependent enzyme, partial [Escherichia coli]|nr:aminotransferase class I/II-fold pyridoxal phosphate-dependent enzyme [Escherichia coli]
FGLAGVRLGFALAEASTASLLRGRLGPWAVSGPALAYGQAALADTDWQEAMRQRLEGEAQRLQDLLEATGGVASGGASLYRHLRIDAADALFRALGRAGVYVRAFADRPDELRFGLPADEAAWSRLGAALRAWAADQRS